MNMIDRVLEIDSEIAVQNSDTYDAYRTGVRWAAIGLVAVVGGLVADSAGVEAGAYVAYGGSVVLFGGGSGVSILAPRLRD